MKRILTLLTVLRHVVSELYAAFHFEKFRSNRLSHFAHQFRARDCGCLFMSNNFRVSEMTSKLFKIHIVHAFGVHLILNIAKLTSGPM